MTGNDNLSLRIQIRRSHDLSLRRTFKSVAHTEGSFGWDRYLGMRDDERIKDWAGWVQNAKFDSELARAQAVNSATNQDARARAGTDPSGPSAVAPVQGARAGVRPAPPVASREASP